MARASESDSVPTAFGVKLGISTGRRSPDCDPHTIMVNVETKVHWFFVEGAYVLNHIHGRDSNKLQQDFDLYLIRPGRDDVVLSPSREIADYGIKKNDDLQFRHKTMPISVLINLCEGDYRKIEVSSGFLVMDILPMICKEFGIEQHEELSLGMAATHGIKSAMEVDWLDHSSTLHGQDIANGDILLLRKKFFILNDDITEALNGNNTLAELIYQQIHHHYVNDCFVGGPLMDEELCAKVSVLLHYCEQSEENISDMQAVSKVIPKSKLNDKNFYTQIVTTYYQMRVGSPEEAKVKLLELFREPQSIMCNYFPVKTVQESEPFEERVLVVDCNAVTLYSTNSDGNELQTAQGRGWRLRDMRDVDCSSQKDQFIRMNVLGSWHEFYTEFRTPLANCLSEAQILMKNKVARARMSARIPTPESTPTSQVHSFTTSTPPPSPVEEEPMEEFADAIMCCEPTTITDPNPEQNETIIEQNETIAEQIVVVPIEAEPPPLGNDTTSDSGEDKTKQEKADESKDDNGVTVEEESSGPLDEVTVVIANGVSVEVDLPSEGGEGGEGGEGSEGGEGFEWPQEGSNLNGDVTPVPQDTEQDEIQPQRDPEPAATQSLEASPPPGNRLEPPTLELAPAVTTLDPTRPAPPPNTPQVAESPLVSQPAKSASPSKSHGSAGGYVHIPEYLGMDFRQVLDDYRLFHIVVMKQDIRILLLNIHKPIREVVDYVCATYNIRDSSEYYFWIPTGIQTVIEKYGGKPKKRAGKFSKRASSSFSTPFTPRLDMNKSLGDQYNFTISPLLLHLRKYQREEEQEEAVDSAASKEECGQEWPDCENPDVARYRKFYQSWTAVVQGVYPIDKKAAIKLAALLTHVYYGDRTKVKYWPPTDYDPKCFLPERYRSSLTVGAEVDRQCRDLEGKSTQECINDIIEGCRKLVTYEGVFFEVAVPVKTDILLVIPWNKMKHRMFGVNRHGIFNIDKDSGKIMFTRRFTDIYKYTGTENSFKLNFKEWAVDFNAYTFQTREILDLLDLFIQLAQQGRFRGVSGPREEKKEDLGTTRTSAEPEEEEKRDLGLSQDSPFQDSLKPQASIESSMFQPVSYEL